MGNRMTPYYEQDGITIFLGDNREVLPFLGRFDLLLTDPPYGLDLGNSLWTYQRGKIDKLDWDNEPAGEYAIKLARHNCTEQIIWGGNYFGLSASRCWLSWHKPDAPPSMGNVEYAWTSLDQNSRMISQSITATNGERVGHPTQKPLRVMVWCLQFMPDAKTVLDPWMGSGTTLVAAKQRGLKATGIEINEQYAEIAVRRLAQGILIPV